VWNATELHLILFNDVLLLCNNRSHGSSRERRRSGRSTPKGDDSMVGCPGTQAEGGEGGGGGGEAGLPANGPLQRLLASFPGLAAAPAGRRLSFHSHLATSSPSHSSGASHSYESLLSPPSPSSPGPVSPPSSPGGTYIKEEESEMRGEIDY
jgi:hypothetical protein